MKKAFGAVFTAFCILVALRIEKRYFASDLIVTFFDIGQGDSSLIQFPNGKTALIDAGGGWKEWNRGKADLLPELARLGILEVDAAIVSHPDLDHAYGFLGVLEHLRVGELLFNQSFAKQNHPFLLRLIEEARTRAVKVSAISHTQSRSWNGVHVEFVPLTAGMNPNDQPLMVLLRFAGCRVLFTGDLERPGEVLLTPPKIDLLKVAHHGSKTSSTEAFLQRSQPRWAVISAGLGNNYGHPNPQVVERLRRHGTEVFRTDFHGFTRFRIQPDGTVWCENSQGSCGRSRCPKEAIAAIGRIW